MSLRFVGLNDADIEALGQPASTPPSTRVWMTRRQLLPLNPTNPTTTDC